MRAAPFYYSLFSDAERLCTYSYAIPTSVLIGAPNYRENDWPRYAPPNQTGKGAHWENNSWDAPGTRITFDAETWGAPVASS